MSVGLSWRSDWYLSQIAKTLLAEEFFRFVGCEHPTFFENMVNILGRQRNDEGIDLQSFTGKRLLEFLELSPKEYKSLFERPFLEMSGNHYQKESTAFLGTNSMSAYLKKVEEWLWKEETHFASCLNSETGRLLIEKCSRVLITEHLEHLCDSFPNLLDLGRKEDLERMYNLIVRLEVLNNKVLEAFRERFEVHIANGGQAALSNLAISDGVGSIAYVDTIFEIWHKYSEIAVQSFYKNVGFAASVERACKKFINMDAVTKDSLHDSPELLVDYADDILHNRTMTQDEVEYALNKVVCTSSYSYHALTFIDQILIDRSPLVRGRKGSCPKVLRGQVIRTSDTR